MYQPLNYKEINIVQGTQFPSTVKAYNNTMFEYWFKSLYHRALSVLEFTVPEEWEGKNKDFFLYCLYRFGFVAVFNDKTYGMTFQPCTTKGFDWYYQPYEAIISNPALQSSLHLEIGKECELLKLTPDYDGIFDTIAYFAEKLASLDGAINMSIINNKFAFILGAKNRSAAEAIKKILDLINHGEPAVVYDRKILDDPQSKDTPFQVWERNLKNNYITTEQLMDFQTILNEFDAEIGINCIANNNKKERMVVAEAESKSEDSTARVTTWMECLQSSIKEIKKLYPDIKLDVKIRESESEEVEEVDSEEMEDSVNG